MDFRPPGEQKTLEWIAVLAAAGLDYRLSHGAGGWVVHVSGPEADAADREISAYEAEERESRVTRAVRPQPKSPADISWTPWWVVALLVSFYAWLGPYNPDNAVLRGAAMDSRAVADGEWWRLITALTVHSGITHIMANALCLLWLGAAVCAAFGGGVTWLLVLVSGAAGNALACLSRGPVYVSIGASGAGFGALGILTAHRVVRNIRYPSPARSLRDRLWLPLGAGLALLALLGTGPGTDLGAHLFGFLCGFVACVPVSWCGTERAPAWCQRVLQLTCLAVVLAAWHSVLHGA